MLTPDLPPNEADRLAAVHRYDILDTLPEAEFDDLTELASHICDTPIALMTILDGQRQWFKSRVGLDALQTERNISFCGHAILGDAVFEVPNALEDHRFADNPLVTGSPDIRFYAGAPLVSHDGYRLGTLCVIDTVPRSLTERQRSALMALGRQVCRQIEARATVREVHEQSRFRDAVFNSTHVGIITLGMNGSITGSNRGAEALFGYPAAVMLGNPLPSIWSDDTASGSGNGPLSCETQAVDFQAVTRQAAQSGAASAQWVVTHRDGRTVPVEATVSTIADQHGVTHGYLCMLRDVSQRQQAQLALRNNQMFLTTLIDTLPVAIYSKSMKGESAGQLLLWNRASEHITGYSAEVVVGKTNHQVFPADQAALNEAHDVEMLRTRQPIEIPFYKITRPDGSIRYLRTVSVPMFDADGAVEFILGISQDVTTQTTQNRELKKRQAELLAVSDASPLGMFRTDTRNECTYVNKKYQEITGASAETAAGLGWISALHPDERSRVLGARAQARARISGFTNFQRYVRPDGTVVLCKVMAAPVLVDGQFTGFVGTVDDITDRRRASDDLAASQTRLRLITDNLPALVGYIDSQQCYKFANSAYRRLLNMDPEAMIGATVRQTYGDEAYASMKTEIAAALRGERVSFERATRNGNALIYFQCDYVPDLDDYGQVRGFYVMAVDVTARHVAEQKMVESESRLRTITDNLPVLITYIDNARRFTFANATIEQWMGVSPAAVQDKAFEDIVGATIYAQRREYMDRALAGERVEFEMKSHVLGVDRHMQAQYIPDLSVDGTVKGFYTLTTDVTTIKESERRLDALARSDFLTGLPNRFELTTKIGEAMALSKRSGRSIALMYLDIDHFKTINDTYGHATGDLVLIEFARRLKACVRETDTVGRLAGDEFVILLVGLGSVEEPQVVARKIIQSLAHTMQCGTVTLSVQASIGIGYAHTSNLTPEQLLEVADKSLYAAKKAGRNTFKTDQAG